MLSAILEAFLNATAHHPPGPPITLEGVASQTIIQTYDPKWVGANGEHNGLQQTNNQTTNLSDTIIPVIYNKQTNQHIMQQGNSNNNSKIVIPTKNGHGKPTNIATQVKSTVQTELKQHEQSTHNVMHWYHDHVYIYMSKFKYMYGYVLMPTWTCGAYTCMYM